MPRFRTRSIIPSTSALICPLAALWLCLLASAPLWAADPAFERAAWLKEHAHPLHSLTSDDFSDLHFLKPLLGDTRILALGESSHGVAEFSMAKVRLITFLHREMGFEVVAFESSLHDCYLANERLAKRSADAVMRHCLFDEWHVEEVLPLFAYLKRTRKTDRPLILAGFDIQESSPLAKLERSEFLRDVVRKLDRDYAREVYAVDDAYRRREFKDREEAQAFHAKNKARLVGFYDRLAAYLDENMKELKKAFRKHPARPLVARRTAWSMARFVEQMAARDPDDIIRIRDQAMAQNVDFLADDLYPGKKIILWGHNLHLRRANEETDMRLRTMGSWLAERHGEDFYTVGLYMHQGRHAQNDRSIIPVAPAAQGSLEAILHQAGEDYLFVDLAGQERTPETAWMFSSLTALRWGQTPVTMIPRDQYDGLLFIDTVTPPTYR